LTVVVLHFLRCYKTIRRLCGKWRHWSITYVWWNRWKVNSQLDKLERYGRIPRVHCCSYYWVTFCL